jgi:hypothetical protein
MYNTEAPDFPQHVDGEHFRVSTIVLPSFAGSQVRNGPYGGISASGPSDGKTHAVCDKSFPVEDFLTAVEWVVRHNIQLRDSLLESLVDHYNEMRGLVIESLIDENPDDVVPAILDSADLLPLCGLVALHIGGMLPDNVPRFGIELGCNWETEHGAGARFSGLQIEEAGDSDHAFSFPANAG